jgi:hypothetical protein
MAGGGAPNVVAMVAVSYKASPFITGREIRLRDVCLDVASANNELASALSLSALASHRRNEHTMSKHFFEAYCHIAEWEVRAAQLWASQPKRWRETLAWAVQLSFFAAFATLIVLYSATDPQLRFSETWTATVGLAMAETYVGKVLVAEPVMAVSYPVFLVGMRRLPDSTRQLVQDILVEPLANLMRLVG